MRTKSLGAVAGHFRRPNALGFLPLLEFHDSQDVLRRSPLLHHGIIGIDCDAKGRWFKSNPRNQNSRNSLEIQGPYGQIALTSCWPAETILPL